MSIGRKEAILALVATVIPVLGRRARAQVLVKDPTRLQTLSTQTIDVADLQRRVVALETMLANQVAFTKDAYGNLRLRGNGAVTVEAGADLSLKAFSSAVLSAASTMTIKGATIALN
jgi:hypothetical protein